METRGTHARRTSSVPTEALRGGGARLEKAAAMEFIIVSTAVGASMLLALGGTRVVLWVLMLGIMRDAAPEPAAES